MIKVFLVASDYDRTLASESKGFVIDEEVARRVNEFAKRFYFVVVTGREKRFIDVLARGLRPTAWILENGSLIYKDEREYCLASEDWFREREKIVRELEALKIPYSLGKIIVYLDGADKVRHKLAFENVRVEWNRNDAMIIPPYVNKGYGLKKFVEMINFKGKIIAVGDSENDISLFNVADYKVAVGNALKEIKEIADIVLEEENGKGIIKLLDMVERGEIQKLLRLP